MDKVPFQTALIAIPCLVPLDKDGSIQMLRQHQLNRKERLPERLEGITLNGKPAGRLVDFAREGQEGARATAAYYAGSGKEERNLIKASFFTGITGGILWYVLIYYWAARGFSSEEIGLMGGIGSSVGVITYLFGGYLADVLGRKKLFLVGILSTATGLLLFLTEKNITVFTVAYGMTSLGGSLQWPSLTTLLAAKASSANMKYLYGIQGFVNQIGLTIATFLGIFGPPFLERTYGTALSTGFVYVFLATAIFAFVPILFVYKVTETKKKPEKLSLHFDRRMRRILLMYCFQNALIGAGAGLVIPWFPVIFKQGLGASDNWVASIITLSNAVIAVGWFVVPKFADLKGSVTLIAVCQIASCVPMILIPYSPALLIVALLYTSRSFLMLVPSPVLNAYMMNICSEEIRASFLSLSQLAWQVAFAGSYAIAGYLWANNYSKVEPFFYAVAFYIVASLIFFAYFKGVKENEGAPTEKTAAG